MTSLSSTSLSTTSPSPVLLRHAFGRLLGFGALLACTIAGAATASPFRDCDVCPSMTVIPAGRLLMGSAAPGSATMSDEEREFDIGFEESPRHAVQIAAFALGTYEVTQREW